MKNRLLGLIALLTVSVAASAQRPQDNSPYSRYGIGNLTSPELLEYQSMGGISTALVGVRNLNFNNPAALGYTEFAALEGGFDVKGAEYVSKDNKSQVLTGSLNYFALGFPIFNPMNEIGQKKKRNLRWGAAFGLTPYSSVGYNIQTTDILTDIGQVTYNYQGSGGTYRTFLGSGIHYKGFSIGLDAGFIFGKNNYNRYASIDSVSYAFRDYFVEDISMSGFNFRGGVQYEFLLSKKRSDEDADTYRRRNKTRLMIGASGGGSFNLNTNSSYTYTRGLSGYYGPDTIVSATKQLNKATMPAEVSVGITLKKDNEWQVGAQFDETFWKQYKNPAKPDSLQNTRTFHIGGEYIPNHKSLNSYFNRVSYRAGFFTKEDPRILQTKQLGGAGVTVGFGFPVRALSGVNSMLHIGLEAGQQGNTDLVRERYARFRVGFTMNDNSWFFRQKYN